MTSQKIPLSIICHDYLKDHRSEGNSILPAVESIQYLAQCTLKNNDSIDVLSSFDARFQRFLPIPKDTDLVQSWVELKALTENTLTASLNTKRQAGKSGLSRSISHVELSFGTMPESAAFSRTQSLLMDQIVALEGVGIGFSSQDLYRDLVPFGPAFQNVTGTVFLTRFGAVGNIIAAPHPAPRGPLGNTFVLDGAFHIACAWGQRYEGIISFPVGYRYRKVSTPCKTGEKYWCRVVPKKRQGKELLFDIFVFDSQGTLAETCLDAVFKDVSFGRLSPASWIQNDVRQDPLCVLRSVCGGLTILDLQTMASFYDIVFTQREKYRWSGFGPKRAKDFASARIALKLLSRKLSGDIKTPASDLETIAQDNIHPVLPQGARSNYLHCAAAHDKRFAIAVASENHIGVDVERLSEKVLRGSKLFLSSREQELVSKSNLGQTGAAIRIWTVKEAATKALDINLAESFKKVQVLEVLKNTSDVLIANRHYKALCAQVDGHIFTVLSISPS